MLTAKTVELRSVAFIFGSDLSLKSWTCIFEEASQNSCIFLGFYCWCVWRGERNELVTYTCSSESWGVTMWWGRVICGQGSTFSHMLNLVALAWSWLGIWISEPQNSDPACQFYLSNGESRVWVSTLALDLGLGIGLSCYRVVLKAFSCLQRSVINLGQVWENEQAAQVNRGLGSIHPVPAIEDQKQPSLVMTPLRLWWHWLLAVGYLCFLKRGWA